MPEEYGGMGIDDYRYNTILIEEGVKCGGWIRTFCAK